MKKEFGESMTYYEYYLSKHTKPICRWFHIYGNLVMLAFILFILLSGASLWWLLLAPLMVYPLAFVGHWFEGSTPAVFSTNPFKARLADWRMCWETITGKIDSRTKEEKYEEWMEEHEEWTNEGGK